MVFMKLQESSCNNFCHEDAQRIHKDTRRRIIKKHT